MPSNSTFSARYARDCCILVISLMWLTSCGKQADLGQVYGVLNLDGTPLSEAYICFIPSQGGPISTAVTDSQGKYRLQCHDLREGATIGDHTITVEDFRLLTAPRAADEELPPPHAERLTSRVPERYQKLQFSPLHGTVHSGEQRIDLPLTRGLEPR